MQHAAIGAHAVRKKTVMGAAGTDGGKMRVLSQTERSRFTKMELYALLRRIASELPTLKEGSAELRSAHINLLNIRRAIARLDFQPG
jgi:hypothetical protein